jgi:hypothetical protein
MMALRTVWRLIVSRRAAVVLLVAIVFVLTLGATLPNPDVLGPEYSMDLKERRPLIYWLGERYNSEKMARGYLFGVIGVFLVLSTLFCSIDRTISRRKAVAAAVPAFPLEIQPGEVIECGLEKKKVEGLVLGWLKQGRWRTLVYEHGAETVIQGSKGRAGFWGSIIFHAFLVTVLIGFVVYQLAGFRGTLMFLEGDEYPLELGKFTSVEKIPLWGMTFPKASLGLIRHESKYAPDVPFVAVDHAATFRITDLVNGEVSVKDARVNEPISIGGIDYILSTGGFAPRVVVYEGSGKIYDGFVLMRNDEISIPFPDRPDLEASLGFLADMAFESGVLISKSMEIRNPNIALKVYRDGERIFKKTVSLGGSVVSGGLSVSFPELRRWVIVSVVDEPGIGLFFYAMSVGVMGVMVRTLDPDRKVRVMISAGGGAGLTSCRIISLSTHFSAITEETLSGLKDLIRSGGSET